MRAVSKSELLQRELPLNVVDLWFGRLPEIGHSLEALLSLDEMRRAMRFRFDRDAANFVARRGLLRMILAAYTGVPPAQLSFTYSLLGKPVLDGSAYDLRFSLSQSGDLAVYAVARRREIGVDIERLEQTNLEIPGIARSFFSGKQIAFLNDTPADQKEKMFLGFWTQLEARGKVSGNGIGRLNTGSSGADFFLGQCFSFIALLPKPGYVVALAIEGRRRCSLRTIRIQIAPATAVARSGAKNVLALQEEVQR